MQAMYRGTERGVITRVIRRVHPPTIHYRRGRVRGGQVIREDLVEMRQISAYPLERYKSAPSRR